MDLSSEQLKVLEIFKEHNIDKGQFLPLSILEREREGLPRRMQKDWDELIKGLVELGLMIYDPLGYGLSEKAYALLNRPED